MPCSHMYTRPLLLKFSIKYFIYIYHFPPTSVLCVHEKTDCCVSLSEAYATDAQKQWLLRWWVKQP
jgi:hypothetical protein